MCFFFQAEDGIRDLTVTGVQTCALPISAAHLRTYHTLSPEFMRKEREQRVMHFSVTLLEFQGRSAKIFCVPIRTPYLCADSVMSREQMSHLGPCWDGKYRGTQLDGLSAGDTIQVNGYILGWLSIATETRRSE